MPYVVDASAVIALLRNEEGAERVQERLAYTTPTAEGASGLMSSVNLCEVLQYLGPHATESLEAKGILKVEPFDRRQAHLAATIWEATRAQGLGLADRACLALGLVTRLPVLTADRAWATANVGVEVELVR